MEVQHLLLILLVYVARETKAVKINQLSVPEYHELNKDGENQNLILNCDYTTDENDVGFVFKWFHNTALIYQWIPPRKPDSYNAFKGRVDLSYTTDSEDPLSKHSALFIKSATIADSGNYTCNVQSYQNDQRQSAQMIVIHYENPLSFKYHIDEADNEVELECSIHNVYPLPNITFVFDEEIRQNLTVTPSMEEDFKTSLFNYTLHGRISRELLKDDSEMTCLLHIPGTDFEQRTVIEYDGITDPNISSVTTNNTSNNTIIGEYRREDEENYGVAVTANYVSLIVCANLFIFMQILQKLYVL